MVTAIVAIPFSGYDQTANDLKQGVNIGFRGPAEGTHFILER